MMAAKKVETDLQKGDWRVGMMGVSRDTTLVALMVEKRVV